MISRLTDIQKQQRIDFPSLLGLANRRANTASRITPEARRAEARRVIRLSIDAHNKSSKGVAGTARLSAAAAAAIKRQKLDDLIGEFKGISPTLSFAEGRISFLLAIVEDAVGKVQSGGTSSATNVSF